VVEVVVVVVVVAVVVIVAVVVVVVVEGIFLVALEVVDLSFSNLVEGIIMEYMKRNVTAR